MTSSQRLLSIVVPVFNEAGTIAPFWSRMKPVLDALAPRGIDYEVLFTNNRSTDDTLGAIRALRAQDERVQVLTFSKNVGYQASVYAGLKQARGDLILVIDVDCEDPPELLPQFLDGIDEGHDLVYGIRQRREEAAPWTWARKIFYRLNRLVADSDIILDMAEFCLMKSFVRDAVVTSVSTYPFLRAEIAHYGFARKGIPYDREKRVAGETHYRLGGMIRFAVGGILSSTTVPLRATAYALPPLLLADAALLATHIALGLAWPFAVLVTMSLAYLCVGVAACALYLARSYKNAINRPLAVVDWSKSATNAPPERSPNALPALWGAERGPP